MNSALGIVVLLGGIATALMIALFVAGAAQMAWEDGVKRLARNVKSTRRDNERRAAMPPELRGSWVGRRYFGLRGWDTQIDPQTILCEYCLPADERAVYVELQVKPRYGCQSCAMSIVRSGGFTGIDSRVMGRYYRDLYYNPDELTPAELRQKIAYLQDASADTLACEDGGPRDCCSIHRQLDQLTALEDSRA